MAGNLQVLCGVCVCLGISTLLILVLTSFSSLEFNEWGLDHSGISKTISKDARTGGIHFLGVGHSFIKFPKTVQTIEFSEDRNANGQSLSSRTADGLEVVLEISFQYSLQSDHLYELYMTYGEQYKTVFILAAIDVLSDLATNYTAYDFFVERQKIGAAMQDALDTTFKIHCFSNIEFFQLRSVDLPDKFEDAIQLTEVKKQDIQRASAQKNKTQVELETKQLEALYQKNVTINIAKGDAQARLAQNNATVDAFKLVQGKKADSYGQLKKGLDFSNTELIDFMKAKVIRDYNASSLSVNMDSIEPNTTTSNSK